MCKHNGNGDVASFVNVMRNGNHKGHDDDSEVNLAAREIEIAGALSKAVAGLV